MANILIATAPYVGHVNPATGIAREFVEQGHDVVWYTSSPFRERVERTGATFTPMRPHLEFDPTNLDARFPARKGLKPLQQMSHDIRHMLADFIPDYVEDVLDILKVFPADVLFTDTGFFAGRVVRERAGVPWVVFTPMPLQSSSVDTAPFGLGLPPSSTRLGRVRNRALNLLIQKVLLRAPDAYYRDAEVRAGARRATKFLLDNVIEAPDLVLHGTVEEFEYPRSDLPRNVRFIGPVLPDAATTYTLPDWWSELHESRPVVHVTQGTVDNADFDKLLVPTLQALAHEDVLVVATTGGRPVEEVRITLPANARLERFVPHDLLLPHVDVMVTNAGFGGVQRALADGVPLVVAGKEADKPEVCQRVAWSGVGINLATDRPTPGKIGAAVREVLSNRKYALRARTLARAFARHHAPTEAVQAVAALIQRRGRRAGPTPVIVTPEPPTHPDRSRATHVVPCSSRRSRKGSPT
ncbi:glycosyltransferase [Deinococcus pimensis]|uniref:glycosyltransferase n=1 Tax=Deinococcus pimensis TaxID=309888 RepID=UPI0004ACACC8|nr:nucleotide disphospho-sugar-binding domain-containing protein [Deinococcus pimensis]